jgi:hypothetical protein
MPNIFKTFVNAGVKMHRLAGVNAHVVFRQGCSALPDPFTAHDRADRNGAAPWRHSPRWSRRTAIRSSMEVSPMIPIRAIYKEAQLFVREAKALVKTAIAERKQKAATPERQPDKPPLPFFSATELFFVSAAFIATVVVLTLVLMYHG